MWQLTEPAITSAVFHLVDIGQGETTEVTQLWQQDIRLINAIERVNWQDAAANFQVQLCETCGIVGCQSQGWVAIRRLGPDLVGILPAFSTMVDASESLKNEYLPPGYLKHGSIFLEQPQYAQLGTKIPWPEFDQLPYLTSWEAAKLFQWDAPHHILGNGLRVPKLVSDDIVIASSEGSFLEQVPIVAQRLEQLLQRDQDITIRPIHPLESVISFYLDLAGLPQWKALVACGSEYKLYLEPGYAIDYKGEFKP